MSQARMMSVSEAAASAVIGLVLAALAELIAFPAVGLDASLSQALQFGAAFTALSLIRSSARRRLLNRLRG